MRAERGWRVNIVLNSMPIPSSDKIFNIGDAVAAATLLFNETGDYVYFRPQFFESTGRAFTVRRYDWQTRNGWVVDYRIMSVEFRDGLEYRNEQMFTDVIYYTTKYYFIQKSLLLKESEAASASKEAKERQRQQQKDQAKSDQTR